MMKRNLTLGIVYVYLTSKLRQTLVAAMGVTFGIATFVFMVSFIRGLNNLSFDLTLSLNPHVRIINDITARKPEVLDKVYKSDKDVNAVAHVKPKNESPEIKSARQVAQIIAKTPGVKGVSALVTTQVFYVYGPLQLNGIVQGVDILQHDRIFDVKGNMVDGQMLSLLSVPNSLIIGEDLATKLQVGVGDRLTAISPKGVEAELRIVGIYNCGIAQINESRSYANQETVQKLLDEDSQHLTELNIKLNNTDQAPDFAARWKQQFGYRAEDWQTTNAQLLVAQQLRTYILNSVVAAILLVAGFGIYNILTMMINEKMQEIAILKAIGLTAKDIRNIFLTKALVIGTIGGITGLMMGFALSVYVMSIRLEFKGFPKLKHLPVEMDPAIYVVGFLFALLTTLLAGYLPARKAGKVDPIAIIRGK